MLKKMNKNLLLAALALGVFFVLATSDAMAQTRCRTRSGYVQSNYNDRYNDRYDNRYDNRYYENRNYRSRDYYNDRSYRDREDTTGNAVKRTGIGAGIGALGGAVIGGKKGALIGAGVGAAGGYLYHRNKVNNERRRY
ncbi:MAG TPA: YMGG-like glycine zipper-containing protein [Blastocatellia bacterium]|nr:YMGG-like glycine zipper-containing protein [Blastocatellia bacterium]HMV86542.1 YMGG-like glycine zipper-containing protein [Blastocatellia bacterium]HMX24993.1 YMGG-like glycine zipper-containing protein [Blastocatellia bacterium]HMY70616.1 YMGG-like glycine zipper-containing protein [Blastocatellia bacterium]HMZ20843.1 YMGG-like glycine zipper-containing protein [Blastocatellia bacterium]